MPQLSNSTVSQPEQYPLHQAARTGNLDEVKRLIANGAAVGDKDNHGAMALHKAA